MMGIYELVARFSLVILAVAMGVFTVVVWRLPKAPTEGSDEPQEPPAH